MLSPGDLLGVYTDGLTEAVNSQEEEFGLERLTAAVGEVRSACLSPTLGRVIALAVLDVSRIEAGGRLDVAVDGGRSAGIVAGYPVYDSDKLRPRG